MTEKGTESKTALENSETYENLFIHYVDDDNRSEEALVEMKVNEVVDNRSIDLEKEQKEGIEYISDTDTTKDSVSSQGDSFTNEDEKVEKATKDPKSKVRVKSLENNRGSKERSDRKANKLQSKVSGSNQKKPINSNKTPSKVTNKNTSTNSKTVKVPVKVSSESSEGIEVDEKPVIAVKEIDILDGSSNGAQVKEIDILDGCSNGAHSVGSEDESRETANAEENVDRENAAAALELKIREMESRIENLEEELREVAALEVSLYSIVPEHGSSAHKVHTPARRLSRLYIHACKHWTTKAKATIAKNTVSGLILVAKSCGNDVSRLTFWLSNTIVLREIISQAFGNACQVSPIMRLAGSNAAKRNDGKSASVKLRGITNGKSGNGFMQTGEDWQETGTFVFSLERVESWIFSRLVESVWWQV
ncbi:hypothetical protein TSUD_331790 [Trifolium subterraneum]|uniref:Dilute domain-containing protein n=1 Tax=Trifolium subterraneum TaxID=3900 RepID=A0A2Z6MYK5_TRISU|nr:hypothetical protein TSUD_331790 [Trifolium subterraneum]